MVLALHGRQEEERQIQAEVQLTQDKARRKIKTSKIIFAIVFVGAFLLGIAEIVAAIGDANAPSIVLLLLLVPVGSLITAYLFWASYWGIPAIWTRWWRMLRGIGCFLFANPFTWLIIAVTAFEIPIFVGYLYGVFGGAIYEFQKCRRITQGKM